MPDPTPKPPRKRTRIDITGLPLNSAEAREILLWWLFRDERDDWPDWVQRPRPDEPDYKGQGAKSVQMF